MSDIGTIILAVLASTVVAAVVSHRGEVSRAREERRQQRLGETYLAVIEAVLTLRDVVERTEPFMWEEGDPEPPAVPSDDEQRRLAARLAAYGSPAMQRAYGNVGASGMRFFHAVQTWHEVKGRYTGGELVTGDEHHKAHMAPYEIRRNEVRPAIEALLDRANSELAERRKGRLADFWARLHRPGRPQAG